MSFGRLILRTASLLCIWATGASAGGVNFSWDACTSEGGVQNKTFACNSNSGSRTVVASFVLDDDMDNFIGIEAKVDISTADDSLPVWWRVSGPNICRNALSATFGFIADPNTSCFDPWSGAGTGGLAGYHTYWTTPQVPEGNPSTAQAVIVAAVPGTSPIQLTAGTEYYGFKFTVSLTKTVGSGSCDGCSTPVCLTLSQIKAVGSDNTEQLLTDAITSSTVTWQSAESCPGAIASQSVTWGQIRSLMH